jgi:cell wall assembly regulator SMI1
MAAKTISRRTAIQAAAAMLAVGCSHDDEPTRDVKNMTAGITMAGINDPWARIHAWLSANAPKISGSLNSGANAAEIAAAEQALGRDMPTEWRELYRVHNGMTDKLNLGSLFFGMHFLTLDEAVREHSGSNMAGANRVPVRAADPGIKKDDIHNPNWVAFAHDGGDTLLRVDIDPAPDGTLAQIIFTDHADATVILIAKSLSQFLLDFALDLEGGKYFLSKEALDEGNEFLDCISDIDVVNWSSSPRWKHLAR